MLVAGEADVDEASSLGDESKFVVIDLRVTVDGLHQAVLRFVIFILICLGLEERASIGILLFFWSLSTLVAGEQLLTPERLGNL